MSNWFSKDEDIYLFLCVHVTLWSSAVLQRAAAASFWRRISLKVEQLETDSYFCSSFSERWGKREERMHEESQERSERVYWQEKEQLWAPSGDIIQLYTRYIGLNLFMLNLCYSINVCTFAEVYVCWGICLWRGYVEGLTTTNMLLCIAPKSQLHSAQHGWRFAFI